MATGTGSATITFPVSAQAAQYVSEVVTTDTPPNPHIPGTFSESLTEWDYVSATTLSTYATAANYVAYNGSVYASVRDDGRLVYSYDGFNWIESSTVGSGTLIVFWAGSLFCAISAGGITTQYTSPNAITWTAMAAGPGNTAAALAYSPGGVIVAPDSGGNALGQYSTNGGVNWTSLAQPYPNSKSVAYGNGVFVIGRTSGTGLAYGPGNAAWTASSTTGSDVTFMTTKFFARDSVAGWVTSTNGITWSAHLTMPPSYPAINSIPVAIGGALYALNSDIGGKYHVSYNEGVTWAEGQCREFTNSSTIIRTLLSGRLAQGAGDLYIRRLIYAGNTEVAVTRTVTTVNTEVVPAKPIVGTNVTSVVVTGITAMTPTTSVEAWIQGNDTTATHNDTEHQLADIQLSVDNIVPGVGFTIYATSQQRLSGDFAVRYVWAD